jgi:CRP-like cAMP-binding protein
MPNTLHIAPSINFLESISPFVKLTPESRNKLLGLMKKEHLPKGHVLVPLGSICNSVYYLERGLARIFYVKDGKEVTEDFNAENSFTCSITGHITKKADNRQTELLEASTVWSLPYAELERLYDDHHDIERLGRFLISQELADMHKRLTSIQFMSAQERYNNFVAEYPSLLQRVPLGMISSYLGITQETLSRIRSKD